MLYLLTQQDGQEKAQLKYILYQLSHNSLRHFALQHFRCYKLMTKVNHRNLKLYKHFRVQPIVERLPMVCWKMRN